MEIAGEVFGFLRTWIVHTIGQMIWLLGLLFVFGVMLFYLARSARITWVKSAGQKADVFFTGWIGVPVHELGHAFFCILFKHRILEMKLFSPNWQEGTLGYVNHAWDKNSTYQQIGNFFIGIGPLIFGAMVLYVLLWFLVPARDELLRVIHHDQQHLLSVAGGEFSGFLHVLTAKIRSVFMALIHADNLSDYRFWIFIYLSASISSHMELSPADIRGAWRGLLSLTILFLMVNLVILGAEYSGLSSSFGSWWQWVKLENYAGWINQGLGWMGALLAFAAILSLLTFILSWMILSVYNVFRGRGAINPFIL